MKTQKSFQFVTRFIFLAVLALCVAAATSSAKAGAFVKLGDIKGEAVAGSPVEVSFDMVDLLEEEQSLLESLAGGSQFEVLGGWEVGSGPGQRSAAIFVDDVDVTSADGRSFILYVLDEEGEESSLDVVVQDDGVLSVYDSATDSEAYFSPFVTEPEGVTSVKPNWSDRKHRPSRYAADSAKKKKKKKKPGPRNPRPRPDPDSECFVDSDCGPGEVCILNPRGEGMCYEPIFKEGAFQTVPKDDPKGDPKPEPELEPYSECSADSDCASGEVCILNPSGEGMCYEPIFKEGAFQTVPKDDPKGDPKPEPELEPYSECSADSDCASGEVCILNPSGEGMCYEPIFKENHF